MLGKAKCKILKEIRQTIADENDIPYIDLYNADNVNLFEDFFSMMDEDGFYIYNNRDSFNTKFHEEFKMTLEGRMS